MTPLQAIEKAERIAYDPDGSPQITLTRKQAREVVNMCRSHGGWAGSRADANNYWVEFTLKESGDLWLHTNLDLSTTHEDELGSNTWPGKGRDAP